MKADRIVPDSSVLVEGVLYSMLKEKRLECSEIVFPKLLVGLLEHSARNNKAAGFLGIDQLEKLKSLSSEGLALRFSGREPARRDLIQMGLEEADSEARRLAHDESATFVTADKIQAKLADAEGIPFVFEGLNKTGKKLMLESYFDKETMSVHLRESVRPYAKKGRPGDWTFVPVGKEQLTQEVIQDISREIIEEAKIRKEGFIEIERPGSTIVQLDSFRIVITKPPFSDGWEITAVRPVRQLELSEYPLSEKLLKRISEQAEGILVAGSPGMGKTTFAAALARYYAEKQKIVKTVEAPRDLVLPDKITQYAISHGDAQEIHDILLLSRPDYTFFDEMRNTDDFRLFADLRLAGIGFIGIVHATKPIDAIQRFVGRIELGVIPQIIDTVIFIRNGTVQKVLSLQMVVKVPSGMTEADLARPVVVVNDFETRTPEYELYSYGEETVVIPVAGQSQKTPAMGLAEKQVESMMRGYTEKASVEMTSPHRCTVYVPEDSISRIIGRQGKNIADIEKQIGIGIDIRPLGDRLSKPGSVQDGSGPLVAFSPKIIAKSIVLQLDKRYADSTVNISIGGDYLLSAKVSRKGIVKIKRNNRIGKLVSDAINMGDGLEVREG